MKRGPAEKSNCPNLTQEDWDFSGVEEWELESAIFFEAVRTDRELTLKILKALEEYRGEIYSEDLPPNFPLRSVDAFLFFKAFPPDRPWLRFSKARRLEHGRDFHNPPWGLTIFDLPSDLTVLEKWRDVNVESPSCRTMVMLVNLDQSETRLVQEFAAWIRKRRASDGVKEKPRPGAGAAPRFFNLKYIAAARLADAGFKFREAQALIGATDRRRQSVAEVRPRFTEPAWYAAVNKGRTLVKTCVRSALRD